MHGDRHQPREILFDEQFIVVYRGLHPALCRAIVERFDQDGGKWPGRIVAARGALADGGDIKRSWDLEISRDGPWADVFQAIHPTIQSCMQDYLARSPILQAFDLQGSGYKIQTYPRNEGFFDWHADAIGRHTGDRVVAMVLYLNDVLEGGETEFFHQGIAVPPRTGRLVLFPAGWSYMHRARVPTSGHKYIIQTFVKARDA